MHYVLDVPWGFKHPDIQYWRDKKVYVYKGTILPAVLRPYHVDDFSYGRWVEDELNGSVLSPQKSSTRFKPRDHQVDAAKEIIRSYKAGWSGFLEADKTGLGKTLSTLAGITAVAKGVGFGQKGRRKANLLIVCPKGVIPQWRNTIRSYPESTLFTRPMVTNYQQLQKLLSPPPTARSAKKKRTKDRQTVRNGKPKIKWDFVIFDEAQYLKNYPSSNMSLAAVSVAELNRPYVKGSSPFVIYSTATPGATPLNFALMANWLARLINPNSSVARGVTPEKWGSFLESQGFSVSKGKSGWTWANVPGFGKNSSDPKKRAEFVRLEKEAKKKQRKDSLRIGRALKTPRAPFIMRSPKDIAGWPDQQIIPLPIELSIKQRPIYEEAWTRFRKFLNMTPKGQDPKSALVETLRYRQKSSLLKVEPVFDYVRDFVDNGNQVYISCEFMETIDRLRFLLEKSGISYCEISGRTADVREQERLKFQKGEAMVALCTVVAGISLHAGEDLPDGTKATSNPRITIILDIRQNNLDTEQALGRAHRDGQNSLSYFPYFEDTVDEKIISSYTNKTANMKSMVGSTLEEAEELENLFRIEAAK